MQGWQGAFRTGLSLKLSSIIIQVCRFSSIKIELPRFSWPKISLRILDTSSHLWVRFRNRFNIEYWLNPEDWKIVRERVWALPNGDLTTSLDKPPSLYRYQDLKLHEVPTEFHRFGDLPMELRLTIWEHSFPDSRILALSFRRKSPIASYGRKIHAEEKSKVQNNPSAFLCVCHASRKTFLGHYQQLVSRS